jgi:hypothetical protein
MILEIDDDEKEILETLLRRQLEGSARIFEDFEKFLQRGSEEIEGLDQFFLPNNLVAKPEGERLEYARKGAQVFRQLKTLQEKLSKL